MRRPAIRARVGYLRAGALASAGASPTGAGAFRTFLPAALAPAGYVARAATARRGGRSSPLVGVAASGSMWARLAFGGFAAALSSGRVAATSRGAADRGARARGAGAAAGGVGGVGRGGGAAGRGCCCASACCWAFAWRCAIAWRRRARFCWRRVSGVPVAPVCPLPYFTSPIRPSTILLIRRFTLWFSQRLGLTPSFVLCHSA